MHKVSPSQLYMWKQCPHSWKLAYVDSLRKKNNRKRFFDLGNYYHELLHVYYQALQAGNHEPGSDFLISYMDNRVKRDLQKVEEDNIGVIHTASSMLVPYIASWSPMIDKGITVVGVEQNLQIPVTTPNGNTVTLNCITDLIYKDAAGRLHIRDHKTGQANSWNQYMIPLENQLLFNSAAYYLLTGELVLDVEISWINSYEYKSKKPSLTERFQIFKHTHNEAAIEFYLKELYKVIDRMVGDNDPVRHYSKDCGKCQYNPICTQELRGFSTDSLIRSQYEKVERDYEVRVKIGPEAGTKDASIDAPIDKKPFSVRVTL